MISASRSFTSPFTRLAFAEHGARHGIERVVLHAHEGAAQQIDAVEHDSSGNRRLAAAEVTLRLANAQRAGVATEIEGMTDARSDALQHRQIEVDDVPAGDHIRIERADALAERLEGGVFVRRRRSHLGHRTAAAVDDEHFIDSRRVHRDGEQARAFRIGLDVERQHARLDIDVRGPQVPG